jgi:ribonuclease M5
MIKDNARPAITMPVIVEGRYDKSALLGIFDATVITTGGFSVFNSSEKRALIRKIAENGVIVLTDSDAGGKQIRSYLSSILPKEKIFNLYIPRIAGKEKRKTAPSKEGMLGVEGVGKDVLMRVLSPFISDGGAAPAGRGDFTKLELYSDGLFGTDGACERRDALCRALSLPEGMNAKALLEALNVAVRREEYEKALAGIEKNG